MTPKVRFRPLKTASFGELLDGSSRDSLLEPSKREINAERVCRAPSEGRRNHLPLDISGSLDRGTGPRSPIGAVGAWKLATLEAGCDVRRYPGRHRVDLFLAQPVGSGAG